MIVYDVRKQLHNLVAAEIKPHESTKPFVALITPFCIRDSGRVDFLWELGPSRSSARFIMAGEIRARQAKILYSYYTPKYFIKSAGVYDWDKVDRHFFKTYYFQEPLNELVPDMNGSFYGFISPDGEYYAAPYGNHSWTAKAIMISVYDEVLEPFWAEEKLLETWICVIGKNHISGRDLRNITAEQVKTLKEIETKWDGAKFWALSYLEAVE